MSEKATPLVSKATPFAPLAAGRFVVVALLEGVPHFFTYKGWLTAQEISKQGPGRTGSSEVALLDSDAACNARDNAAANTLNKGCTFFILQAK